MGNDLARRSDRGYRWARVRKRWFLHDVFGFVQIRVPASPVSGHVGMMNVLVAVGSSAENASLADRCQVHRGGHRVTGLKHFQLLLSLFRRWLVFHHLDDDDAIFGDCFGVGQSSFESIPVGHAAVDVELRMPGHDVATNQRGSHLAITSGTFVQPFADPQISGIRLRDNSDRRRFSRDERRGDPPRSQLVNFVLRFLMFFSVVFSQAVASSGPRATLFDAGLDGSFGLCWNYQVGKLFGFQCNRILGWFWK